MRSVLGVFLRRGITTAWRHWDGISALARDILKRVTNWGRRTLATRFRKNDGMHSGVAEVLSLSLPKAARHSSYVKGVSDRPWGWGAGQGGENEGGGGSGSGSQ